MYFKWKLEREALGKYLIGMFGAWSAGLKTCSICNSLLWGFSPL